jgi:hypothetical protein
MAVEGQTTFEKIISDPKNQIAIDVLEISDGYILSTDIGIFAANDFKTQLFKIDKYGEILYEKVINTHSSIYTINKIIDLENDYYLCFAFQKVDLDSSSFFTVLKIDSDFNIIWEKKYLSPFYSIGYYNIEKFNTDYYIIGNGARSNNGLYENFSYRVNAEGDTVCSKIYPGSGIVVPFAIIPYLGHEAFKVFVRGYHQQTNTMGQIMIIDTLLEMIDLKGIPSDVFSYNDAKYFNNSHYLLSGKKTMYNSSPQDDQLAIMIMDTSDVMIDIKYFGAPDTLDYPSVFENLSFTDTNSIFYGGTKNTIYTTFPPIPSWFIINNLKSNLDLNWQKFYGGDAYYQMWTMIATTDGGCLMAGTRYDYLTQNNERDIFIIKVDANGLVTGVNDEPPLIPVHDAILYPNPATENVTIEFSQLYTSATLQLMDISGKTVFRSQLTSNRQTIDISAFPAGTYVYTIFNQKGLEETGKLVVE